MLVEDIRRRSFLNDTEHQVVSLGQQVLQRHSDRHRLVSWKQIAEGPQSTTPLPLQNLAQA